MRKSLFNGKRRNFLSCGKREDNGKWAYGYFWSNDVGNCFIRVTKENDEIVLKDYEVIPETVGQYTGLTDKNGKQIFEGDILKNLRNQKKLLVAWHGSFSAFIGLEKKEDHQCQSKFCDLFLVNLYCEKIGNIHDNPELWEGEQ